MSRRPSAPQILPAVLPVPKDRRLPKSAALSRPAGEPGRPPSAPTASSRRGCSSCSICAALRSAAGAGLEAVLQLAIQVVLVQRDGQRDDVEADRDPAVVRLEWVGADGRRMKVNFEMLMTSATGEMPAPGERIKRKSRSEMRSRLLRFHVGPLFASAICLETCPS